MLHSWSSPTSAQAASYWRTALLAFVASAFLLPTQPAYSLVFYVLLAVLGVQRLRGVAGRNLGQDMRTKDAGVVLAGLLIAWSALTLLWGHDDGHRTRKFAIDAVCTLGFVIMMLRAWADAPFIRRRLETVLIWAGTANATIANLLGVLVHSHDPRMHGWGVTSHPILGASVMTIAYLAAVSRALDEARWRAAHLAAAALMMVFILFTGSRGPMLAACVATLFLFAAGPWRWRTLGSVVLAAGAWFLLPARIKHHEAVLLAARGASHRFEIWNRTLRMVGNHPLLGNGLAANLDLPGMTFPHDLYLSVLFYSGAVGLALFAALAVVVTLRLWRSRTAAGPGWRWMAALWINTLMSGLTDLGQIVKGPGPIWLIVWLPIGLILATSPRPALLARRGESRRPAAITPPAAA